MWPPRDWRRLICRSPSRSAGSRDTDHPYQPWNQVLTFPLPQYVLLPFEQAPTEHAITLKSFLTDADGREPLPWTLRLETAFPVTQALTAEGSQWRNTNVKTRITFHVILLPQEAKERGIQKGRLSRQRCSASRLQGCWMWSHTESIWNQLSVRSRKLRIGGPCFTQIR